MSDPVSELVCSGCDHPLPEGEFLTFSCPNRGTDDTDHVLQAQIPSSDLLGGWPNTPCYAGDNPFVRYRHLSHTYLLARRSGMSDETYLEIADELANAIEAVDGRAPAITPVVASEALNAAVKNETVNVSGSHKARHLIGTALHLEVARRLGKGPEGKPTLAIASCGNAALAAAVVAKAIQYPLRVFVPPWADAAVTQRLTELGAEQVVCERNEEDPPGDPCYLGFREAVREGALPFSCQGGDNALALLGGHTLGWELIEQKTDWEHLFIQVGGGALASSIVQAFMMARRAGLIESLPSVHAVQPENSHPLARAWQKLQASEDSLALARHHRSEYMWPWEQEPRSIATGILDDETYDWFSILEGIHCSAGSVITVSEERLEEAQKLGQESTGIAVDATGTAGLAGLLEARSQSRIPVGEACAVLFTGAIR